ncbi:MAG: hypothetical protein QY323_02980 [Patescibacteria group bacterium]|nr:MAG: hypothetical protein QY323_02980 [Patescibacteria group bacterium]
MRDIYKRLLVDFEVILLVMHAILLVASLWSGEILQTLAIIPVSIFAVATYATSAGVMVVSIYFLVLLALPITSIVIHRNKYLILNTAMLVVALVSVYGFWLTLHQLMSV